MKILGVDYGDVRMGLALSSPDGFLAGGLETVRVDGLRQAARLVAQKAREHGVEKIIIGLPYNINGTSGERMEKTRLLIEFLRQETEIPIEGYDERYTTLSAHKYLNQTGVSAKKRKNVIDTLSAQILLQDYLDRQRNLSQ